MHCRHAGNEEFVGCIFWTAVCRGHQDALRAALQYINQSEKYHIDPDSALADRDAIGFLIDILIDEYAPKPFYQGWADLDLPLHQRRDEQQMTDSCVVLDPICCCGFFTYEDQLSLQLQDVRTEGPNS